MIDARQRHGVAFALAALSSLVGGQTAQACAADDLASAARLVEFETLMMTVSLRCTRAGMDLRPAYDSMIAASAMRFEQAQEALARQLGNSRGAGYDRYVTQVANRYGGGVTDPTRCAMFRAVATELAQNPSQLPLVADAMVPSPLLREAGC